MSVLKNESHGGGHMVAERVEEGLRRLSTISSTAKCVLGSLERDPKDHLVIFTITPPLKKTRLNQKAFHQLTLGI